MVLLRLGFFAVVLPLSRVSVPRIGTWFASAWTPHRFYKIPRRYTLHLFWWSSHYRTHVPPSGSYLLHPADIADSSCLACTSCNRPSGDPQFAHELRLSISSLGLYHVDLCGWMSHCMFLFSEYEYFFGFINMYFLDFGLISSGVGALFSIIAWWSFIPDPNRFNKISKILSTVSRSSSFFATTNFNSVPSRLLSIAVRSCLSSFKLSCS